METIKKNKITALSLVFLTVLGDIFFIEKSSDIIIFSALGIYVLSIFIYKIKSNITFRFCMVLLIIMFSYFLISGPAVRTEKAAVWLVLFLFVGIIQQWKE